MEGECKACFGCLDVRKSSSYGTMKDSCNEHSEECKMNKKTDYLLMSLPDSENGAVEVTDETLKKWLRASAESLMARTNELIENLANDGWSAESAAMFNYEEELKSAQEIYSLVKGLILTGERVRIVLQRREIYSEED